MQIFFRWQFTDIARKTWLCLNEKIASNSDNEGRYCTIHANLSGSKLAKAVWLEQQNNKNPKSQVFKGNSHLWFFTTKSCWKRRALQI